jgi:DNA-binding NarL/FixJ family response regulator
MNIVVNSSQNIISASLPINAVKHVMIIHDSEIVRIGLATILAEVGLKCHMHSQWQEAIKFIAAKPAHCLLLCDVRAIKAYNDFKEFIDQNDIVVIYDDHQQMTEFSDLHGVTFFHSRIEGQHLQNHFMNYVEPVRIDRLARCYDHQRQVKNLSPRQFQILELMATGLLNKQIAWELGLTEGTIKSHVSSILEKMKCSRRTQAIADFLQFQKPRPMHHLSSIR